jgi:hypothetical protein
MARVYEKAIASRSIDLLAPYLSTTFSGVVATGDEVHSVDDLKALSSRIWNQIGEGRSYSVGVAPAKISQLSPDLVLITGSGNDRIVSDLGNVFEFQTKWSAIGIKENQAWKLLRLHVSMDPIDNAFIRFFLKGTKVWFSVVSGVLGILVGCLLTLLFVRRRKGA